ncbi:MAG: hypothetical protein Q8Q28_10445 [Pseudomonadota bacterium]|nr:hypothetical protein [Pseudomonadota bacterium]
MIALGIAISLAAAVAAVAGRNLLIPPGTAHCLHNNGGETLRLLCACAPAYRHEDTETLE